MSDLELNEEVILDHNKSPRNFHRVEEANQMTEGCNRLCGDQITLYIRLEDDLIREISFRGNNWRALASPAPKSIARYNVRFEGENINVEI